MYENNLIKNLGQARCVFSITLVGSLVLPKGSQSQLWSRLKLCIVVGGGAKLSRSPCTAPETRP